MRSFLYILLIFTYTACSKSDNVTPNQAAETPDVGDPMDGNNPDAAGDSLSYLALGDSYTIGQGVLKNERWPMQLTKAWRNNGLPIKDPVFVAATGWTTRDLLSVLEDRQLDTSYHLVSLLIGVNNQYQGVPFDRFKEEFQELLDFAIQKANAKRRVIVLSIPDYGVTPFGEHNEQKISLDIDMYNAWIKDRCSREQITYYDVTEISREAKYNRDLLADDNLHPSASMYARWVDTILADPPALFNP